MDTHNKPSPGASRHPLPEGEGQFVFKSIVGHKQQLELLSKALGSDKLAHAYLFAGPAGVGKRTIARQLARRLLGQSYGWHPDYIEIASDGEIKIAQIRELVYKLSLKPYSATHKVAVIDEAHTMNSEAANALLKSLEEPKNNTVIILVTSNPSNLPKTIVSRTQKITFGGLNADERANLPAGNPELLEKFAEAKEYYQKVFSATLAEKLILAQELAEWETADIKILFEQWLCSLQIELRAKPSVNLVGKLAAVAASARLLDQNINSKLLLANLMIKI